jgi:uncharacterized protein (TIGR03066 family)
MKESARKRMRQAGKSSIKAPARAAGGHSRWRWALLALCLLVPFGGTWAAFEFVVWNRLPGALVGKWVVTEGEQEGATFDFYRGGTMVGRINMKGREGIVEARVRVEDKTLFITTTNPFTHQEETRTQAIRVMTGTELVLEDGEGHVFPMRRAQE